jgi:starvation-inducible DNA-binding protein
MTMMNPTRNDLPENVRLEVIALLNDTLADGIDLALQAKHAHWNVKGPHFFQLHELFDKLYEEATEWNDLAAERAAQLGGVAEGTLQRVSGRTRLGPYKVDLTSGRDHLEALSESLSTYVRSTRKSIDVSAAAGDAGTADLFTEITREADKMLWFLDSHLRGRE